MFPNIQDVQIEHTSERLKVVLPVRRRWLWTILFSALVLIWLGGLIWGLVFLLRDIAFSGQRYAFVFSIILLIWLFIWYRLGKIVWRQWQFYVSNREILFIDKERLIVRRPVSILGITDAYDLNYVSPFIYSDEERSLGFDYGHQRVYFGQGLEEEPSRILIKALNEQVFDEIDEADDY